MGQVPVRLVTCTRPVMDYILGRGRQPKSWPNPFPPLQGGSSGCGEIVILVH